LAQRGKKLERFPEDIYELVKADGKVERREGPLYQDWIVWRAGVIQDFVQKARATAKEARPSVIFADYCGSWYPSYYNEGLNWASRRYDPRRDFDWAPEGYQEKGFAEDLDMLFSGFYYPRVTIEQATKEKDTPWWASIEGAGALVNRVVRGACPVIGGLYVKDYEGRPEDFVEAMCAAYDSSDGLMIFDMVYFEEYGWWSTMEGFNKSSGRKK
jgi:hypothetical protein